MELEIIAANLIIFSASVLQAATGVGFAMLSVPLLALISLDWVPAPMLICNIALSFVLMAQGRQALDPTEASPLVAGLVIGTAAGGGVLTLFEGCGLGLTIGAIIVLAVLASRVMTTVHITRLRLLFGASLRGATGVIAAMHGPPLLLLYQREAPQKVRATMAGVFLFGCFLALGSLWMAGLLEWDDLWRGLILLPGVGLGYFAGKALGGRMSPRLVRHTMLAVSGAAGVALLIKTF